MTDISMPTAYQCHCCGSNATSYLQHYVLRRSLAVAPMYLCGDCQSISVDYGVVKRHYPQSNSRDAIEFHKRIRERNEKWSSLLLDQIAVHLGGSAAIHTVIDIGCGIGTLLTVAARRGARAIGYEVEALALAEARTHPVLEMHDEFFTRDRSRHPGSLLCCIAVLEHLHRPLLLLREIAAHCLETRSSAFVFVPTLPGNWPTFLEASVLAKGNPFFDNEEHISHFSAKRLADAWRESFGADPEVITAGGWQGFFFMPRH